ncbi:MAG: hypothetical protein ACR2PK_17345 [Acidimicrobiales bacterium]
MRLTPERGFVLFLFALAAALSVATATDPDLWWHLRTGELILNDGIPTEDVFSFTVAGTDWVAHEWGSQVLLWGLWQAGGATALIVTFTALVTATFVMAYRTSRARPVITASVVVLAAAAARIATAPRPQMFNLALLAGLILLFEKVRSGSVPARWVWVAVPLVAVWANLHSGYLLGVVTIAVYALGERAERASGGRPMPTIAVRQLPWVAAASLGAAVINPSGPALWTYPIETLRSPAMRTYIREWHSPDFHSSWFWPFGLLLLLAAGSMLASPRRPGWTQLMLISGTAVASLQSMRHIPLFAVVAVPIVAEQLEVALDAHRAKRATRSGFGSPRIVAALSTALGAVVVLMITSAAISNNDDAVAGFYPVDAVDVLLDSELADQPGYNAYGWGGYLIWRDVPVFIDGRADVYGDEFMYLYFQAEDAEPGWREPLDQFDIQWVLLPPDADLGVVLDEASDWTSIYEDGTAEIFARCRHACPVVG